MPEGMIHFFTLFGLYYLYKYLRCLLIRTFIDII